MKEVRKTFEIPTAPSATESFTIFGPGVVGLFSLVAKNTSGAILINFTSFLKGELVPSTGAPTPIVNINSLTGDYYTDGSGNIVFTLTNSSLEDVIWAIEYEIIKFD